MLKLFLTSVILSASLLAGEISVAVAANLTDAVESLKTEFAKTNPAIKVNTVLGASGKFTTQIKNGAPFDVFLSADMKFPESLYADGIAVTKPVVYASGALAMVSTRGLDLSKGLALLTDPKVEKVAIANPKTAPYGTASIEAFKNANVLDKVEPKLVQGDSIGQALQFSLTAADVGFVNASAFYSDKMKEYKKGVQWVDVDPKLYKPIAQGIVLLKQAEKNADAKAFYDFVLSAKAKEVFKNYGYVVNE
ncbi:molybdate ABC transporter substrate-binding protein [Sulfurospirillum multivorans]|uniref:Molybdenum ABC transporter, periplasmic molybdenum-binding protein ModA n=2 Tax=Sulfurospirillum multivorans TaxID=66821 RepID=A0AA86E3C1_SULMK|nr:molybdate ABC transporter substrate-binding protein [Sulfurospirillum multivorans]AHJ13662.1 molybdenum ABC transporter, periplasmic molybdenum-binding protein ModA [Sulfurospirillum multivorans DSM 12446]QEH07152.1 molybdenum ABC transporter, periplasmic molybdenum-binding protein ModA [Sulfurospirillum multivorans]